MIRSIALAVALVLGLGLAGLASRTPHAAPATAAATAFSAERALAEVRVVARAPHPTGSPANAKVRDYLVSRLTALGFATRVQRAEAFENRGWITGGAVENVIGVLPGRDRAKPALAIMAHYDSVPGSPGGADDAAGVASALETARALRARGQAERDIILVLTDGEEIGLLGAKAFFEQDPLAVHIGAVVNMDTRGGGGRAYMFETSRGNGPLIDLFRRNAVRPTSTSLAVFLYEHMPNGTDFTIPKDRGVLGLNFAFIGRQFDYHSPSSTAASLEPGALQHMGEQVLAASSALAFAPTLPGKGEDAVYADLFGGPIVAYPPLTGWLVLALGMGVAGFTLARIRRRGGIAWPEAVRGAGGALYLLLLAGAALSVARHVTGIPGGFTSQRPLLAQFHLYEVSLVLTALGAMLLTAAAFAGGRARLWAAGLGLLLGLLCWPGAHDMVGAGLGVGAAVLAALSFGKATRPWNAWAGFVGVATLFAAAAQALAPGIAFLFGWPLLLAAITGLAASLLGGASDRPRPLAAAAVLGTLGFGWLAYLAHPIALGVGADLPAALSLMTWLSALVLAPLVLASPRPVISGSVALLLGLALAGLIGWREPWSAAQPRATHVLYVQKPATGEAWRATTLENPDRWTLSVLGRGGGLRVRLPFPALSTQPLWAAKSPALPMPAGLGTRTVTDGTTTVALQAPAGAERIQLVLKPAGKVTDVRLGGAPVKLMGKPGEWSWIAWSVQPGGRMPALSYRTTDAVEIHAAFFTPGWPAPDRLERYADQMAWSSSDSSVVLVDIP